MVPGDIGEQRGYGGVCSGAYPTRVWIQSWDLLSDGIHSLNAVLDADIHVGETVAVFGQGCQARLLPSWPG